LSSDSFRQIDTETFSSHRIQDFPVVWIEQDPADPVVTHPATIPGKKTKNINSDKVF
jgi:hypothetical protein